ncbi:MAG: hypothetical protein AABY13_05465 [Nanoarchaeota archaeon]
MTYYNDYGRGGQKFWLKVVGGVVAAGALVIGAVQWANGYEYSRGKRVGVINKFSEKGFLWKTHEGEMALEGIVSSGGATSANIWQFSLDDSAKQGENLKDLAQRIDDYASAGRKVSVEYVENLTAWPWRGSTSYFVQKVTPVENKETTEK